jgi:polyprenyl-phospho-N-acetylgalactosaminyl synthase
VWSNPRVFVVIAAYNEAATIRDVVKRVLVHYPCVVVVDDGSTDGTLRLLQDLDIFRLRHVINRGQGASLQTGIRFALRQGADVIVTFDADGQHHEKDIPVLVDPILRNECDVCLGSRFLGVAHNMPFSRRLVLGGGIAFARIVSGVRVTDVHNGLRALSRTAAESLHIATDRMAHASEILDHLKRKKLRFKEVPVDIYYSRGTLEKGQSSWNALRIAFEVFYTKIAK